MTHLLELPENVDLLKFDQVEFRQVMGVNIHRGDSRLSVQYRLILVSQVNDELDEFQHGRYPLEQLSIKLLLRSRVTQVG